MAVWNPWHGCRKYSAGCKNCYVYRTDALYGKDSSIVRKTGTFDLPVKRNRAGEYKLKDEIVYTCMTSDFFIGEADLWRDDAWRYIRERRDLLFFIITKRIERFGQCIPRDWGKGYPNVAICCTTENQACADRRLPFFLEIPAAAKFIIADRFWSPSTLLRICERKSGA